MAEDTTPVTGGVAETTTLVVTEAPLRTRGVAEDAPLVTEAALRTRGVVEAVMEACLVV